MIRSAFIACLFVGASAATATAQTAPPRNPCAEPARHGLDFWIGRWTVADTASGTPIAQSVVERLFDGCALRETYDQTVGPDGKPTNYHGSSYTAFNSGDQTWRQFYVDTSGAAFSYVGHQQGNAVVLEARAANQGTRMTLRREANGTVRQIGEVTKDSGATWQPNFDFTYQPR